jgi:hypothetical protein
MKECLLFDYVEQVIDLLFYDDLFCGVGFLTHLIES